MNGNDWMYREPPADDVHDVLPAHEQLLPLMQECIALENENLWLRIQLNEAKAKAKAA